MISAELNSLVKLTSQVLNPPVHNVAKAAKIKMCNGETIVEWVPNAVRNAFE